MNLYSKLQQRSDQGQPLRVGVIGAGKFASMYLAQVPKTPGIHVVGIADLSPQNARANLERVGWQAERYNAGSLDLALTSGTTFVGDDWRALVSHSRSTSSSRRPAIRSPRSNMCCLLSNRASMW